MAERAVDPFEIFITRKGPALISGVNRVAIIRSVISNSEYNSKVVELCNITADTKLPKSSVFSALEDMVSKGVLKYATVSGKKGYAIDSYRILRTIEPQLQYAEFADDIVENAPAGYGFNRLMYDYVATAALTHGMDLTPIAKTIGNDFGRIIVKRQPDREAAMRLLIDSYGSMGIANISIVSRLPLTIVVEFHLESITGELARIMAAFVLSSFAYILSEETPLRIGSYSVEGGKVTGTFVERLTKDDFEIIPYDFKYDDDADTDFMMYISKTGAYRSIENPLGLAIMDVMSSTVPMSSAEITKALDQSVRKPQSSVLFYLEKMIDMGLVSEMEVKGKRRFIKCAINLYNWFSVDGFNYDSNKVWEGRLDIENSVFDYILTASITRMVTLNMSLEPVIRYIAASVADAFCRIANSKTIEAVMSMISTKSSMLSLSDTSITSFMPFSFVRRIGQDTNCVIARTMLVFDSEFYRTIIANVTGINYNIVCKEHSIGNSKGYKLQFTQQPL